MSGDTSGGWVDRLPLPDRTTVLTGVLAGATGFALLFVLVAGFFAGLTSQIGRPFYLMALLFPLFGFGLVVLGLYWLYQRGRDAGDDGITESVPETGSTAAVSRVGVSVERSLSSAASNRYRCRQHSAGSEIAATLRQGAIRHVRTRDGHDYDTARSLVDAGEWTDDPIAAAFLAREAKYPLTERVRGALDPGAAYWRRVDRTLTVIEQGQPDAAGEVDG